MNNKLHWPRGDFKEARFKNKTALIAGGLEGHSYAQSYTLSGATSQGTSKLLVPGWVQAKL